MSKVIKIGKKQTKQHNNIHITDNLYRLSVMCFGILSIIAGSIFYKSNCNEIIELLNQQLSFIYSDKFSTILFQHIKIETIFFLINFILGTSFIGASISIFIPIIKCFITGIICSYFYNQHGLHGVLFCLLLLIPFMTITTASLIYASNESIYMSKYIFKTITNKNTADNISIKLYLIRYAMLYFSAITCSFINSFLIIKLLPLLNLNPFHSS